VPHPHSPVLWRIGRGDGVLTNKCPQSTNLGRPFREHHRYSHSFLPRNVLSDSISTVPSSPEIAASPSVSAQHYPPSTGTPTNIQRQSYPRDLSFLFFYAYTIPSVILAHRYLHRILIFHNLAPRAGSALVNCLINRAATPRA